MLLHKVKLWVPHNLKIWRKHSRKAGDWWQRGNSYRNGKRLSEKECLTCFDQWRWEFQMWNWTFIKLLWLLRTSLWNHFKRATDFFRFFHCVHFSGLQGDQHHIVCRNKRYKGVGWLTYSETNGKLYLMHKLKKIATISLIRSNIFFVPNWIAFPLVEERRAMSTSSSSPPPPIPVLHTVPVGVLTTGAQFKSCRSLQRGNKRQGSYLHLLQFQAFAIHCQMGLILYSVQK